MSPTRYPQFCALARAAEILGERWTLLIVRELLLGPKRFSDLRGRLDGISTSVLTERLARLEDATIVRRTYLEPPAASTVYHLTDAGQALQPAILELIRWGGRFLLPARSGERTEPEWMRLALAACARKTPTPEHSFQVRIVGGEKDAILHIAGGPEGTSVSEEAAPADATIRTDVPTLLSLVSGMVNTSDALREGRIQAEGDLSAVSLFPQLFEGAARQGVSV
jgi:DNA-binding HxlR family transcriptional regulator/putative sterol carrier protein